MILKPNSIKGLLINVAVMLAIGVGGVLFFFYTYLPNSTNHGDTITVPDLEGRPIEDIAAYLEERDLLYEVNADSGYSSEFPPLTVLKQYPLAEAKVKEKRKIYLTINSTKPPKVKMAKLVDLSLKSAEIKLKALGLVVGKREYKPDMAFNAILEQQYEGEEIPAGKYIHKGSKIDLIIGDGYGKANFSAPNLIGMELDVAEFSIEGSNLKIGVIIEDRDADSDSIPTGTVTRQTPSGGESIRIGEVIDLWVKDYEKYKKMKDSEQ